LAEQTKPQRVICRGGLSTNNDTLTLSEEFPGMATRLLNYEISRHGGYRRIEGTELFGTGATLLGTGATLGVWISEDTLYGARALLNVTGGTYNVHRYVTGVGWATAATNVFATGSTDARLSLGVSRVRVQQHNFAGVDKTIVLDGLNYPGSFDGTDWTLINGSSDVSGAAYAQDFRNHMAYAGMPGANNMVVISAPNTDNDFAGGNGALSINVGFTINGLAIFREKLYVFGVDRIKRIVGSSAADFKIEDVTTSIGCVAPDSIIELGGDVLFLSYDGVRTISGTERVDDIDLSSVSDNIKSTIVEYPDRYDMSNVVSVVIRSKTQFRYFVYDGSQAEVSATGLIGGIRYDQDKSKKWEFGDLLGIQANCAFTGFIDGKEVIVHGGADGAVYRQENRSTSFSGSEILSIYSTPFLDQGNTETLKDYHRVHTFINPEGIITNMYIGVSLAWEDPNYALPANFTLNVSSITPKFDDFGSLYDSTAIVYDGSGRISKRTNITSCAPSIRFTFVHTSTTNASFSIQGFVIKYLEHEMVT
jgi:hypothetical protein